MPKPYTPNDKWSQKASEEGYRARSVYKLQELDQKFRLIRPNMTIVDLGAAPGSWLQYTAKKMNGHGTLIGIDLQEIEPLEHVYTAQADITDIDSLRSIIHDALPHTTDHAPMVDLILSDLAPRTSGIKDVDQWKSIELSQAVLTTAKHLLKPKGMCIIKVLRGADFDHFLRDCKQEWSMVKTCIAKASRDRSKEVYVLLKR